MTSTEAILADLGDIVGAQHVLVGRDVSDRFDGYPQHVPVAALCIVRPADTAQVSALLAYCHRAGIAVVPHGGRTGIAHGARARPIDVVLSLERMAAIEEVDATGSTMVVQAGVPLQRVQEAARDAGLLYPVDLGARGTATIGGTISTNAGGNSVLRYGMTRDHILGIEAVLADGTIISSMNRMIKNNAGYDLKQLFIGTEGTLGVVTRAVVRLRASPGRRATALVGLDSFDGVLALLAFLGRTTDGGLNSFEVMWRSYFDTVIATGRHRPPLKSAHRFYVLMEIVSSHCDEALEQAIAGAWEDGLIADATIAASEAQTEALWAIRDDIEAMMAAHRPLFLYDISMRQSDMEKYVHDLQHRLVERWPDAVLLVFGHVADGNLHVSVWTGDGQDNPAVDDMVYGPLKPLGGSVSAEHGIGLEKRDYLAMSRSAEEIALMRLLKRSLDPKNILNPDKVIPA